MKYRIKNTQISQLSRKNLTKRETKDLNRHFSKEDTQSRGVWKMFSGTSQLGNQKSELK